MNMNLFDHIFSGSMFDGVSHKKISKALSQIANCDNGDQLTSLLRDHIYGVFEPTNQLAIDLRVIAESIIARKETNHVNQHS